MKLAQVGFVVMGLLAAAPGFALEVGQAAPCVDLQDVQPNGTSIDHCIRTRETTQTFALLEFFSTTCSDCAENLPKVSALQKTINATTEVRLIGIDRDAGAIQTYINDHRDLIQFPVAIDSDRDAKKAYDVSETPTVFILDANNTVIYKHVGVFSDQDQNDIRALVVKAAQ